MYNRHWTLFSFNVQQRRGDESETGPPLGRFTVTKLRYPRVAPKTDRRLPQGGFAYLTDARTKQGTPIVSASGNSNPTPSSPSNQDAAQDLITMSKVASSTGRWLGWSEVSSSVFQRKYLI